MANTSKEGVFKYSENFARMGSLVGVFIAELDDVECADGQEVYLGEVLGKHSEVSASINSETVKLVSSDPAIVALVREHGLESGVNPIASLGDEHEG